MDICCANTARPGWYMQGDSFGLVTTWVTKDEKTHYLRINEIEKGSTETCFEDGRRYFVHKYTKVAK